MSDAINTYLFCNIGVSGVRDWGSGLSPVKLCIYPATRYEMKTRRATGAIDHNDYKQFRFEPLDDQYVAGQSLSHYDMSFDYYESQRLWKYIKSFPGPACLVAYGCESFHYPILRQALQIWTARRDRVSHILKFADFRSYFLDVREKQRAYVNSSLSNAYFELTGQEFPDEEIEVMGKTLSHIQMVLDGAAVDIGTFMRWTDEFCKDFVL